jgi:dipeptidyl aminopeptidase/acylaminoacyl peptidase
MNWEAQPEKHMASWKASFEVIKERGSYLDDVVDAKAALDEVASQDLIDPCRIAVLGQSAGVYTACLLAKDDSRPKAFVLQGGLYRDYAEMMAFNYRMAVWYAEKSTENLAWIEENDLRSLVIGLNLSLIEERARKGETEHNLRYKEKSFRLYHDPTCYSEDLAPSRQFRHIRKPALVIHGACDMNVPVGDASLIERELISVRK